MTQQPTVSRHGWFLGLAMQSLVGRVDGGGVTYGKLSDNVIIGIAEDAHKLADTMTGRQKRAEQPGPQDVPTVIAP